MQGFADYVGLAVRTVQRWESTKAIPSYVGVAINQLVEETKIFEAGVITDGKIAVHRDGWRIIAGCLLLELWWQSIAGKSRGARCGCR